MPLNSEPPAIDAAAFLEKKALAEARSCTDFALWGGLVPGNADKLEELKDAGAIGLKAFLCDSGIASFPSIDGEPLREAMRVASQLDLLVAVHAEDETLTARLTAEARARRETSIRAYLDSRPIQAEVDAISRAIEYADQTGCRLHVVHVSSWEGLAVIENAKRCGVDVTAETCPHYLLLNEADVLRLGAPAKCSPPLRNEAHRTLLWNALFGDQIDTVGSDHSPSSPDLKTGEDFFALWGGIAGIQHGFTQLLSATADTLNEHWPKLAAVCSENVARRFRLPAVKGSISEGGDADFAVLALHPPEPIRAESLVNRHPFSPYVGRSHRVRVVETFIRGKPAAAQRGQFLRPE
jgi:allantoinase